MEKVFLLSRFKTFRRKACNEIWQKKKKYASEELCAFARSTHTDCLVLDSRKKFEQKNGGRRAVENNYNAKGWIFKDRSGNLLLNFH